ncbi:PKD domain-containing protein [Methanofollis ethanolicus]|uniref:PKD domain-containing protein n=1 Tax=Methanofollis ethanolicus TaxID=488124 RepID=UPI00082B2F11|nr:PKD domain-containing protein [Methanofollis ethanolicus]
MTHTDTAASELTAVMALIAIFMTAAAVVGVMVLSNPPGDKAPAMLAHVEEENGSAYLYHDGGDPLEKGHFTLLVDGAPWTNATLVDASGIEPEAGMWTTWGTGQALVLSGVSSAAEIRIVADGVDRRGGSWLIFENGTAATPTTVTTVPTTTTIVPTTTVTAVPTTEPTPVPIDTDFVANMTLGTAPLTVGFTDLSTGDPTAWSWDFGDGVNSTEQNPTHIYTTPGIYTVKLTASNTYSSDNETKTAYIIVQRCAAAGITGTYYPTIGFTGTPVQRIDRRIWFADQAANTTPYIRAETDEYDWPQSTLGKQNQFSVIYEGYLIVPADDTYTFYLTSDDGSWLWLDAIRESDPSLIDNGGYHKVQEKTASIALAAGAHPIKAKMFENQGEAVFHLEWSSSAFGRTPINSFCQGPGTAVGADFTADPTAGEAPLTVQFTDMSTGAPTAWSWDFGDGATSTDQHPTHTYTVPGTYTVTLTASKTGSSDTETKTGYITVGSSFIDYVIDENVFVYGNALRFGGNTVTGTGATIVITGGLDTADLNGGASVSVSTIYIDGDVTLDGGSAGIGSATKPGNISINGDLTLKSGGRDIYGDVYVAGDFSLKDARVHDNVYVDGDLTLDWTPTIDDDARIYYTGTFTHPPSMDDSILSKCIHTTSVPAVEMPDQKIPSTKPAGWYAAREYVSGGALTSTMKVYADRYSSTSWSKTATNVVIIAYDGDITITGKGGSGVTGVFFAPRGKVTFEGAYLEGVVIARDGFFVTSGGTEVTFKNIENYISNPNDYPF